MRKHTKGPWFVRFIPGLRTAYWIAASDGEVVSPRVEGLENAVLVASAPALLDTLEHARNALRLIQQGRDPGSLRGLMLEIDKTISGALGGAT